MKDNMIPTQLLDSHYYGESIIDVGQDVEEAIANCSVPVDEHGFQRGSFRVTVTWVEDEHMQPIPLYENEDLIDQASAQVAEALGVSAYDCTRVWEAWHVGTMRKGDFVSIAESSERTTEIARAALKALQLVPTPHIAEVWHEGTSSFYRAQLLSKLAPIDVDVDPVAPAIEVMSDSVVAKWYKSLTDDTYTSQDFFYAGARAAESYYRGTKK